MSGGCINPNDCCGYCPDPVTIPGLEPMRAEADAAGMWMVPTGEVAGKVVAAVLAERKRCALIVGNAANLLLETGVWGATFTVADAIEAIRDGSEPHSMMEDHS